jgi:hypothetical protein
MACHFKVHSSVMAKVFHVKIIMNLEEIRWKIVHWIHLAQVVRAAPKTLLDLRALKKSRNFRLSERLLTPQNGLHFTSQTQSRRAV